MRRTEQEKFWEGQFGDDYIDRNRGDHLVAANVWLFSQILETASGIRTVLELGANIGQNLEALAALFPTQERVGVEIHRGAFELLRENPAVTNAVNSSILEADVNGPFDLVFLKGVLIHCAPESLESIYDRVRNWAGNYVAFVEYYNPTPVEVQYRGHSGKLFKRDFAGEFLDRNPNFKYVSSGFSYHRDPRGDGDDFNWFLMQRVSDEIG